MCRCGIFHSQESLTAIQWILRAIVFFFLLFATKIMGQRSISQLRMLDFAMAITLGNIIAHPLSDEGLGMKGSMITMAVLVALYLIGVFEPKMGCLSSFDRLPPIPLIKMGKLLAPTYKRLEYLLIYFYQS